MWNAIDASVLAYGSYLFGSWFTALAVFLHATIGMHMTVSMMIAASILTVGFGVPIAIAIYYFFAQWYLPSVERLIERQKIPPIFLP